MRIRRIRSASMDEFAHERMLENAVATAFFKCTRWLVEETGDDASGCAYHYFCDTTYAGDYPPVVDFLVLVFAAALYLSAMAFTLLRLVRSDANVGNSKRRYLLPSGPVAVPAILLILSKGSRINTLFPLSVAGPAILHLLHVSALSFEYRPSDRSLKYAVLEASAVSGILHSSLYLDSIVMPYYTGLEALRRSTFSGECRTCVCRSEPLAIGGGLVSYRGWSKTTAAVVGTLSLRMLGRALGEERSGPVIKLEVVAESLSWILVASDVAYLTVVVPRESGVIYAAAAYGGLLLLIFLNVLRKVWGSLARVVANRQGGKNNKVYLCKNSVEYP